MQYFSPLFLPPQTSWLNSAETAFAIMKKRLQKHFLFLQRQLTHQEHFIEQVSIVLDKMVHDLQHSTLYRANLLDIK